MKLLVTGASGFVGSALLPRLFRALPDASISLLLLPGERIPDDWSSRISRVDRGDIVDREIVDRAIAGSDRVVHLAACVSYCRQDRARLTEVNAGGVQHVVDACIAYGVERLVHISSIGALGCSRDGTAVNEQTPFNWPGGFYYMKSKYQGQQIVEQAVEQQGLRAVILNPASIMGPGDPYPESSFNRLMSAVYRAPVFPTFTGGQAVVDVRDVADIVIKALLDETTRGSYILAGHNLRYGVILRALLRHAGRKPPVLPVPSPLLSLAGLGMEGLSGLTGRRPLLTFAYGRLSGWESYCCSDRSRREFEHTYIDFERTSEDSCRYFEQTFLHRKPADVQPATD